MLAERDDDEVMEVWFEEFRTILSRYTIVDLQRVTCRSYFTVATIYARISLCQNLRNHMPVHIGQATLDSVVVIGQPGVVDAKQMQCGRMQIVAIGTAHWTAIAIAESKQTAPMSRFTIAAPASRPSS